MPKGLNLDNILCVKATRALRNDFTVAYNKKLYQIEDPIRAAQVKVHERLDGSIVILAKDRSLKYREILTRPVKEKKQPVSMIALIEPPMIAVMEPLESAPRAVSDGFSN